MKKELLNIVSKSKKFAGMTGLKIQKRMPEITLAVGIIGFGVTLVSACKATLGANDILEARRESLDVISKAKVVAETDGKEYDSKRDLMIVNCQTAVGFAKLYGFSAAVGAVSLACILTSHNIMKTRYLGAVAAYNAVSGAFKEYRKRVIDEGGRELDRHYMFGTEIQQVEKKVTDEKGKTKTIKEDVVVVGDNETASPYARFFSEENPEWNRNPELSLLFLKAQEAIANNLLHTRGYLFLNEVYDLLHMEPTQLGAICGWIEGNGDGFVDFGLYDGEKTAVRKFINGESNTILLDFNVDGMILDLI